MKKFLLPILGLLLLNLSYTFRPVDHKLQNQNQMSDFHQLNCKTLSGEDFDFSTLKGKRVLIVNTASECGYTPQYGKLQELHETYGGEKFVVIGFPSNDFGSQEPGSNEEIEEFCKKNYGVTFQMMSKISVKGKDKHPVYQWLTESRLNKKQDVEVEWNFNKFLIDGNGNWISWMPSKVDPLDNNITEFASGS